MRLSLKFAWAVLALAMPFLASAQAAPTCPPAPGSIASDAALLCWVNATADTNGNPLPATGAFALTQTRVQRVFVAATATCGFSTVTETLDVPADTTRVFLQALPAGKHCFRARHHSLDAAGVQLVSDWSPVVSKVVVPSQTRPRSLTISIY